MTLNKALVALAVLAPAALAQQAAYGQCGGTGWTGATTCVSGYVCTFNSVYYSQCIPGSAPPPSSSTSTAPTTTTTKSVPPPTTSLSSTIINSCAPPTTTTVTVAVTVTVGASSPPSSSKTTTTTTSTTTKLPTTTTTTPPTSTTAPPSTGSGGGGPVTSAAAGNPFSGYQFYANPYYSSEIFTSAIPSLTGTLATKASAVAEVGTFFWMDSAAKVPLMETYMSNIEALNAAGANPPYLGTFVIYDLPDRDCAAAASNGEYTIADNGVADYFAYIDSIVAVVKNYPTQRIVFIVEPDSLANLVTNLSVQECAEAESAYLECVTYAMEQLNLANVAMYLDAGHAGWLGWAANIGPAADLFATLYKNASEPAAVRGLATNVANYNGWNLATAPSYTSGDSNYDEMLYVNNLAPLLTAQGFPAHFITDQSRSGVQPTQQLAWGDWCNVIGTGFGIRPTINTGDPLEDAFVWVKPGGECDGTSNSTAPRFDFHCAYADALQPAPQAGAWFQAYFEQLLVNANPSF